VKPAAPSAPRPIRAPAAPKPRRLSQREQLELAGMEDAILAAEQVVSDREASVQEAATAGHVALAAACQQLEEARQAVERLFARWQELESRRDSS